MIITIRKVIICFLLFLTVSLSSTQLDLYNRFHPIDNPIHTLAGVMIALAWGLMLTIHKVKLTRIGFIISVAGFALIGSFAWELWEYGVWIHQPNLLSYYAGTGDTLSDMSFGLLGGIIVGIFCKRPQ